jgi:hypothetical protein
VRLGLNSTDAAGTIKRRGDSERAAMIYQHQARGADKTKTDTIDKHVDDERDQDGEDDDSVAGVPVPA